MTTKSHGLTVTVPQACPHCDRHQWPPLLCPGPVPEPLTGGLSLAPAGQAMWFPALSCSRGSRADSVRGDSETRRQAGERPAVPILCLATVSGPSLIFQTITTSRTCSPLTDIQPPLLLTKTHSTFLPKKEDRKSPKLLDHCLDTVLLLSRSGTIL